MTAARVRRRQVAPLVVAIALVVAGCGGAPPSPAFGARTPITGLGPTPTATPQPTARATSRLELDPPGRPATVIRVVDGDTIHALVNGVDERVRIIGLDSPETSKPGTPVECLAKEATAAAERLLAPGDPILLQPDPTQDERDRYDRLLAHVFLADGTLFAASMIRGGWAVHYVYDGVPSIHAAELAAAEADAKTRDLGLWSPATCNGNPHEATPDDRG